VTVVSIPAARSVRQVYSRASEAQRAVLVRMAGSRTIIPAGIPATTTAALRAAGLLTPALTLSVLGHQVAALALAVERAMIREPHTPTAVLVQRCADHLIRVSEASP